MKRVSTFLLTCVLVFSLAIPFGGNAATTQEAIDRAVNLGFMDEGVAWGQNAKRGLTPCEKCVL